MPTELRYTAGRGGIVSIVIRRFGIKVFRAIPGIYTVCEVILRLLIGPLAALNL
jgi:hypothetical protein